MVVPDLRVVARTGDTSPTARAAMLRQPPHLLITTPESLYLLVTAARSRERLRTVRTVIVDEIHAVARDKRGSHLALTLERLDALAKHRPQRIGLSATQRPIETIARLLVGAGEGRAGPTGSRHAASWTSAITASSTSRSSYRTARLEAVASHEQWGEILDRIAAHVRAHRTTLIFVNTRRLAERLATFSGSASGRVRSRPTTEACPRTGGSGSRRGSALASSPRSSPRHPSSSASTSAPSSWSARSAPRGASPRCSSGWAVRAMPAAPSPRARLPHDARQLVEATALLRAVRAGQLDRVLPPARRAGATDRGRLRRRRLVEDQLFDLVRRAAPYADLGRAEFDAVVAMLSDGIQTGRGRRAAYFTGTVSTASCGDEGAPGSPR